jgi:DNA-binding NarL/FixJ family response regulator
LVGRQREMDLLEGTIERLGHGPGAVIHVFGQAGIGKSRLLMEARELSARAGHLILGGRATEFERDYPFAPFVDALDAHLEAGREELAEELGEERLRELAGVFPSLGGANGGPPVVNLAERFRAYDAVRVLLERLSARRPLVIALDDLQWADSASIELLSHLLRRPPRGAVLILIAYRPPYASPRLGAVLEAARRESGNGHSSHVLELESLNGEDCERLLSSQLDGPVRARLCRESGGNPFYLEQLARTERRGFASPGPGADPIDGAVPAAVAASIAGEIDDLPVRARELLRAAAVVGEPFDPELAATVAGLEAAAGWEALDELSAIELVRPTQVARQFRFRHPILRRAVYESAPPGWRINAHRAADAELERRGAAPADRAHHIEKYAGPEDLQACAVLTEAAEAVAASAPGTAATWYRSALSQVPPAAKHATRRINLLIPMALSLGATGRLDESSRALQEVLELWPREPSSDRAATVWFSALIELLLANHAKAEEMLIEGLWDLPDPGSSDAARLKCGLALSAYFKADWREMRTWAGRALSEGRDLPSWDRANATAAVALAEYGLRNVEASRERTDEAAALVDAMSDEQLAQRIEAIVFLGWAEHCLGRPRDAVVHMDRAIALARATGQGHLLSSTLVIKGSALLWLGELTAAAATAQNAIESALLSSDPLFRSWAFTSGCFIEMLRGNMALSIRHGEEAVRAADAIRSPWSAMAPWFLAEARLELGEVERCREILCAGGKEPVLVPFPIYTARSFELLARLEIHSGDLEAAEGWAREAQQAGERLRVDGQVAEGRRAMAEVLLASGRHVEAVEAALASAEAADRVEARVEAARSRVIAGRALAADGQRDEALRELSSAATVFSASGARRYHDQVTHELRRLGYKLAPAQLQNGRGALGLTRRQLEVAELVADGKTNREIAEQLFLSEKGVESHLRRIFDKLDLSSRAALAAIVERSHSFTES